MARRIRKVKKLNLSDHTLDVNIRKNDYEEFDFSEIEEYVRELSGNREYQFLAIKQIMIYLWGNVYPNIKALAKENYKRKTAIQERFQSLDNFLRHLPLPDRLSGVIHMATGTGKSYIIFAIAYLSIILGKVKRVLVLGPSSTVIERGLNGKFKEYLYGKTGLELRKKLPQKYQDIHINLLNENDPITDNSIVIENINSIYNRDNNALGDTLFSQTNEVLVLSDEVHHAYSHLKYTGDHFELDGEGGTGDTRDERLWMKYLREEPKIKRHIGFTGTPYNQDEYFADVIYDYSIKDATDDKYIKVIDPIIKTESDEGDVNLNLQQRYQQILDTHYENKTKYSFPDDKGNATLKPISIFINNKQATATRNTDLFVEALAEYLRNKEKYYRDMPEAQLRQEAREKIICVISKPTDDDYHEKLEAIEELDPDKPGGKVEFVFAVNKLSEGWDVDNVYQIVPMEERVFDSKLLISQVLGRGLRLPRRVALQHILNNYPVVTITNHEKFADHIKELVNAVTMCETKFISKIVNEENERFKNNFDLFNLEYSPTPSLQDTSSKQDMQNRELILKHSNEKLGLNVTYFSGERKFQLAKNYYTIDQVALEISDRFAKRKFEFENFDFDFGDGFKIDDLPDYACIEKIIRNAMNKYGIKGDKLSEENKKACELFFNQFLPKGKKKRVLINVEGLMFPVQTSSMDASSIRSGEIDRYKSVFVSEDYLEELSQENIFAIQDLQKRYEKENDQDMFDFAASLESKYITQIISSKQLYVVNPSLFKTPQDLVVTSYAPERDFVFKLVDNGQYIGSWVKSRDMGFYSLGYEFWKKGKDRVRRSFNPDFFITIDLDKYILKISETSDDKIMQLLKGLQDKGKKEIIKVVEIKSDDDQEEVTRAKERYGKEHFESLNKRLDSINPIDLSDDVRKSVYQHYTFDLLRPEKYAEWFSNLQKGNIVNIKT